ncbi:MAG: polysaccharide deacetylase family protein [Gammaproteobacteria bacterium]|nr:polysaccharide deacetylase family protein [Gammaproteobacteria bacterium]NND59415.1 DUF2334 domain-containing protein [Gammaproteobacteria bacterium]
MPDPVWLVSVHDLMPAKMPAVERVVDLLDEHNIAPLTLLVVPGHDWTARQLDWLRSRVARGDALAGHGWAHQAGAVRNLYDRLHRQVFSRGVAEHLALDGTAIAELMCRCHDWFPAHDLPLPEIYVPPAWAMGDIAREKLGTEVPFRLYETLSGFYDAEQRKHTRIPLLGFEADTGFRALSVRLSNTANQWLGRLTGQLRVAIHPDDLELKLGDDLRRLVATPASCGAYLQAA